MATGTSNLDISPCFGTDVPGCHLWDEEQATSESDNSIVLNINASILQIGRDNVLNFRSVDDPNPSENPSRVESGEGGPVLREHWKPRGLLRVGRSRLGFPDSEKDHLVQLLVCKSQHTREALDVAGHYYVTVTVSYDGASGSILHLPDYQSKRIKSKTKGWANASMIGIIGYLFRFHEPLTKYKIKFCLNAIPSKRREKKRSLREHSACETICQMSVTLETGPMKSSKSDKTKKKTKESTAHVSPLFTLGPPSLSKENTVLHKRSWWVFNQLRSYRANAKWNDFEKLASDLLLKFTDMDTQIAIKLEQAFMACQYQNQQDRALQLIDEAFSFMCEAKNPQLMASRGYVYQAEILRRQGSLGKAENCLNLAGQNIATCQTTPDTSLVAYGRASMLITFIECTPHRSLKQVKEVQSILEKCIEGFLHVESNGETESIYLNAMKQLFIIALHKMTILLLDCGSDAARKRIVSKECIAKAQWCLHMTRNKYWSEVTQGDRTFFYLGSSDLEYRRGNFADAEEFARLGKDKAVEMGFKLEAFKERLDFMRAITRGDTINSGLQQSESDHEGENADISSSEAESDWLTEKLS